jgi:hypothetical protein
MVVETTRIKLSRALKLKNRVVNRLAKLDELITTCNSTPEGTREYDVRDLFRDRLVLAAKLVQLKTAINAANQPVQQLIFELAECKSLAAMLGRISTQHGSVSEGYSGVRTTYVAQFRKPDVDREVRRVEREIDRIQDELDRFNYETMIAVESELLANEEMKPNVSQ